MMAFFSSIKWWHRALKPHVQYFISVLDLKKNKKNQHMWNELVMKLTRDDRKGESTQQLLLVSKKATWTLQFLKVEATKVFQLKWNAGNSLWKQIAKDALLKDILLHTMEHKQIKPALIQKQGLLKLRNCSSFWAGILHCSSHGSGTDELLVLLPHAVHVLQSGPPLHSMSFSLQTLGVQHPLLESSKKDAQMTEKKLAYGGKCTCS